MTYSFGRDHISLFGGLKCLVEWNHGRIFISTQSGHDSVQPWVDSLGALVMSSSGNKNKFIPTCYWSGVVTITGSQV